MYQGKQIFNLPGTEKGPKCIKMPILSSSYQSGNGLVSKLSQSGVYCPYEHVIRQIKLIITNFPSNIVRFCRQIAKLGAVVVIVESSNFYHTLTYLSIFLISAIQPSGNTLFMSIVQIGTAYI